MSRNWLQFSAKRAPVVSVRLGNGVFRALVDTGAEVSLIAPNTSLRWA
jgi:aspartyl protease